jgi:hypothetical protein
MMKITPSGAFGTTTRVTARQQAMAGRRTDHGPGVRSALTRESVVVAPWFGLDLTNIEIVERDICISRAKRVRRDHELDKDGTCIYCDRRMG